MYLLQFVETSKVQCTSGELHTRANCNHYKRKSGENLHGQQ